ncbi:MAG TPA: AEC family transporter [Azoarcus taiwanensis]|nr:AEC family transporter [Azoarcus taiwanensis]
MQSLLLLLPDFSLILIGALLRRYVVFPDGFWPGVEKLVYFVLFPALLFNALANVRIDAAAMFPLVAAGLCVLVSGFLLGLAGRPLMGLGPMAFASRLQCAYRFNTYIGIALAGKLHGTLGVAVMGGLAGAMVPFANLMAVGMLARHGQVGVLREISRNPLVIATLCGLLYNVFGPELGASVSAVLNRLGGAAVTLGLLAVGAALRWGRIEGSWAGAGWIVVVKLMLLPAIAWLLGRQLGLDGMMFELLILFAALPSASSAYILAMRMGGDGPGVAWLISVTTLLAMPTIALWLQVI